MPKECRKCGSVCFSDQKKCSCGSDEFEPYFEDFSRMRKDLGQQKDDNSSDKEKPKQTVIDSLRSSLLLGGLRGPLKGDKK